MYSYSNSLYIVAGSTYPEVQLLMAYGTLDLETAGSTAPPIDCGAVGMANYIVADVDRMRVCTFSISALWSFDVTLRMKLSS